MTFVGKNEFTGQLMYLPGAAARHPLSGAVRADRYPVCPSAFTALVEAEDQLDALAEQLSQPGETYQAYLARVVRDMADGKPVPENFPTAAVAIVSDAGQRDLELVAVGAAQELLAREWKAVARDHADEVLGGFRSEHDEIVRAVRAAARVMGDLDLADGEAVAEAGAEQQAAVRELKALRPRYRHVITLQQEYVETVWNQPPVDPNPFAADRWSWASFWGCRVHEFADGDTGHLLDSTKSPTWFRPLVRRKDAWLPSLTELDDAWSKIRGRVRPQGGDAA